MSSTAMTNTTEEQEVDVAETKPQEEEQSTAVVDAVVPVSNGVLNKKLLLCRRFKDSGGIFRNFNSLPLFVYATSPSTHATSADGVGVAKEAAAAAAAVEAEAFNKNDSYDLALCNANVNHSGIGTTAIIGAMDCLPLSSTGSGHQHILSAGASGATGVNVAGNNSAATVTVVGTGGIAYQHHLNLHHLNSAHHQLLGHHTPYSNNYPLHHSSSHHHIHSDQTKSLQELQHEVGALLEFRDLVIETFPDLKHKMASMSSSSTAAATTNGSVSNASVSGTNTLTGSGGMSNSSLVSRREWEPGIRLKRKVSQKEPSTSTAAASGASGANTAGAAGELSSSSLTRSRSNSHSGKKEPKSGENNNGSVVQDSGFSTETSSSKEGHSASSTNGAMTGALALNRLSCPESDDELLNLLDVIHRRSNRIREEMDHLQNYERHNLRNSTDESSTTNSEGRSTALAKSSSGSSTASGLTPKTFREHVERLNKEDIKQLRKERDRLLDKLAEMEAETLTGRIKAAKMNDQVEELVNVKKDLEEQLKLAMAQKLELSSRVQQLQLQQQQQQQLQSKSSSSQSDYSSQRNFLSSATTVLSTGSAASVHMDGAALSGTVPATQTRRPNTFQPVVIEQQQQSQQQSEDINFAFHQSAGSDNKKQQQQQEQLGRLDGIVSTPGGRNGKCRVIDSKRFAAILLETSVIELQRHLLTLTVQNQVLMQKLDQANKSKNHFAKRLDKSKDDVEDLRFQLEEKNIELEGTKAQLRVLESRIHSSTPSSGAATNSYLHSQNDYETNRSSASTTLMLSRRGITNSDTLHYSDLRSTTPTSQNGQMPSPNVTQISTPSMKAMVHLPMDELQQHSSSTESAHDHEIQSDLPQSVGRIMSASVGGVSPFEQSRGAQQNAKKLGAGSKPSKIPLPGSKATAYFAGKPPSGRPSTAGRSPPSGHTYAGSNSSSKSSLSRSTGNLLYSKSPNSLKRADSAQSIRKDNSSISTNTSRSSTSSSIPMATTPYATSKSQGAALNPSPRVLQNSPLPKLKRESLTSRVRHLDSLSRVHQHNHSNISNGSDVSCTSPTLPVANASSPTGNHLASSTPKPSSIAAQLNANMRKDMQVNSHGSQQFGRRTTGGVTTTVTSPSMVNANNTVRRFSSASVVGARIAGGRNQQEMANGSNGGNANSNGEQQGNGTNGANASDSDSGKHSLFYEQLPHLVYMPFRGPAPTPTTPTCPQNVWASALSTPQTVVNCAQQHAINVWQRNVKDVQMKPFDNANIARIPTQIYQNPNFDMCYDSKRNQLSNKAHNYNYIAAYELEEQRKMQQQLMQQQPKCAYFIDEDEEAGAYYSNDSISCRSSEQGSDNLLVTFDYGYCDSLEAEISANYQGAAEVAAMGHVVYAIKEEEQEREYEQRLPETVVDDSIYDFAEQHVMTTETQRMEEAEQEASIWFNMPVAKANEAENDIDDVAGAFKVHYMQHELKGSVNSLLTSFSEYDVDDERSVCSYYLNKGRRLECNEAIIDEVKAHIEDVEDELEEDEEEEEEQFYDSLECVI